ncbi:MAG: hypothetical protein AAF598_18015 [Bacteroidota bacterium]
MNKATINRIAKCSLVVLLMMVFLLLNVPDLDAQCAMCAATAESNLKNGGAEAKGLNRGILYLLSMPYLLAGTIAFLYWRQKKKAKSVEF